MNKKLAKVIMMGLLCASVLPSVGYAKTYEVTGNSTLDTTILSECDVIKVVGDGSNNDISINVDTGNNNNGEQSFYYWEKLSLANYADGQNVVVTGTPLVFGMFKVGDYVSDVTRIYNEKDLTFDNEVSICCIDKDTAINNAGTLTFNDYLSAMSSRDTSNLSEPTIINQKDSTLNINSSCYLDSASIWNGESLNFCDGTVIHNAGELNIKSNSGSQMIYGDIVTESTGVTNITLGGKNMEAYFAGAVHTADGGKLNLQINDGAIWNVSYRQKDVVDGLVLNDGMVMLGIETDIYWGSLYSGVEVSDLETEKWTTLKLTNLKSDGNFKTGGFTVHTDLANNKGDKIEFISLHEDNPKLTIPVYIRDKVYEGWWNNETSQYDVNVKDLFAPDGMHSVTIATSPVDSGVSINTDVLTYGEDNKVYKTVVNEEVVDGWKNWNFVGWEATGGDKADTKQEMAAQQSEGPDIMQVDTNNTIKRLNELRRDIRTDPSEVGVWMRGETGETKIGTYSYDYNLMSGGYDWHNENDARILFTGIGLSYAINDCDDAVIGDTKSYGVSLYGSWYGKEKNEYVDLVLKYGKLDKEYAGLDRNGVFVSGDYAKDMFSIATKYGRRIYKDDWYWEPSVGFTWGKVGSADFIDNLGTNIHAASTNSMIASLGMQVGKNINGIEYYGKAEVMHDFDGKISVSAPGIIAKDDMGGTWVKCAIGASRKVSEHNSFYLEIEKDFGNKVEKPYGIGLGYRFTW